MIVSGGTARDFLGEYMAGGIIIVLGLNERKTPIVGEFVGTGMHGGTIYVRGKIEEYQLGKEVKAIDVSEKDLTEIKPFLKEFCKSFGLDLEAVLSKKFTKLIPYSHRPYGRVYSY